MTKAAAAAPLVVEYVEEAPAVRVMVMAEAGVEEVMAMAVGR